VVDAEKLGIGLLVSPSGLLDDLLEFLPDIPTDVGESRQRDGNAVLLQNVSPGPVEEVEVRVLGEKAIGDLGALMISRDEVNGDALIGELLQGLQGHGHELGGNAASIQEIAAVEDAVDLAAASGIEGALEVGEEVRASSSPLDAGAERHVEPEVGVGEEEDPDRRRGFEHGRTTIRV
jgi:hypothetical protein